nr:hypothetical protein [Lacrimispora amygdalina]
MFRSLQAELQTLSLAADNLNMNQREPAAGAIRQQVLDFIGENACGTLMFVGNPEQFPVNKNKWQLFSTFIVTCKNPFQISFADGIFAFQPMFSYGQRSKCADLLNSYNKCFYSLPY